MPPSSGDVVQSPEPKSTGGGLASVFKSFTSGGKLSKTPPSGTLLKSSLPAATVQLAEQLNTANDSSGEIYGGPVDNRDLLDQLKNASNPETRAAAADSLSLAVADYPLTGISAIWYAGKDLIKSNQRPEIRRSGYLLLTACVKRPASDLERKEYFDTLTAVLEPMDFPLQLAAVIELCKNGRDLSGFHYETAALLTRWLRSAFQAYELARKPAKPGTRAAQSRSVTAEETSLHELFGFVNHVIKFSFNATREEDTVALIDEVLHIAMQARSSVELEACIDVLDALVTYGAIPTIKLRDCVKVLCSIHCLVRDIRPQAWQTISNLCRSHNGHSTVNVLLDILRYPEESNPREIRGALAVIEKVLAEEGENGFPIVSFSLLMDAISMLLAGQHSKLETDILKLVLAVFADGKHAGDSAMDEDWTMALDIAAKCASSVQETSDGRQVESLLRTVSPVPSAPSTNSGESSTNAATSLAQLLYRLITKVEELLTTSEKGPLLLHKDACIAFFTKVHAHLPESCANLVIDHYDESRFCYPSELAWKNNIQTLLEAFFNNKSRPSAIRLRALKAITDVYEVVDMMDKDADADGVYNFVSAILSGLVDEINVVVLQEVVAFAVSVADNSEIDVFEYIMKQFHQTIFFDRGNSPLASPPHRVSSPESQGPADTQSPNGSLSNIVTRGLVQIYMRAMDNNAEKAVQSYEQILQIARSDAVDTDARISAMKLLFRIRADWADRVFITPFTESDALAASLYRTAASLAKKHAEDEAMQEQSRVAKVDESTSTFGRGLRSISSTQLHTLGSKGSVRHSSGVSRTLQQQHQMWMTPDPNALPAHVSGRASVLFASWVTPDGQEKEKSLPSDRRVLRIHAWLDVVIELLQQGCGWEIYSYVLVHLAAQLANPGVFKAAVPQIRELRKLLCEQLSKNSFHEAPLASGLRKADVAICLYQSLTMLISYHSKFQRPEEDELVKAFVQGLTTWERTAKGCIHALSICCHELPSSMRSSLFGALQKMSQIITQSQVAVHVLEYLACLARLPELYSNFREEEYRFIFGICFRYLQSVRERPAEFKSNSNRQSGSLNRHVSSPTEHSRSIPESSDENNLVVTPSDDLPQYVYALAYHVVIFWFLALRLSDRAGQVSWIIKNLVAADDSGKQHVDEQTQVTIDFMQRTAYANVDESKANPDFKSEKYGEILKRRWVVGQSIITIEQASGSDWAQITKRQPSATSHYMIHERFERPPPHQILSFVGDTRHSEVNMVLPNYLLLQLGTTFAMSEPSRPVPLPDDDMVKRAIQSFDRISTLDGHKVGVIYIGENQTDELEILSNVMGSYDYTEFLEGLGTLTKLKGATFNTQGLDRQFNGDGEYTFCWRDRVTEIVFHVTTLMPTNLENDPQCIGKKRHIGNDYVNIIFNNSGLPFKFDTFPSDFNFVNIVITPESRASFVATRLRSEDFARNAFYKVQVMSKPGFPEISPAAETKLVSLRALPEFIRLLALNASVFSTVWDNRQGNDTVSSWRSRLREIGRLREKYGVKPTGAAGSISPPGTSQGSTSMSQDTRPRESLIGSRRASVATFLTSMSDHKEELKRPSPLEEPPVHNPVVKESMVESLDFSRWA